MIFSSRIRFCPLVGVLLLLISSPRTTVASEYRCKVPGAKIVFGATPSHSGTRLLVFYSGQEESEELSSGTPAVLDVATCKLSSFAKLESLQIDATALWEKNGHVLLETTAGIAEADPDQPGKSPKLIFQGETHGLALSEDNSKFAVWRVSASSWSLSVIDLATLKILRKWTLPFAYSGEATGFEIAFLGTTSVYARTFDIEGRTPLMRFDLETGKTETLEADCLALAASQSAVYYLTHNRSGQTLKKLTDGRAEVISPLPGYDDLRAVAGNRWIAVGGAGKSAAFDTTSNQISGKSSCETTTVLSDGTQLYIKKATLSSDPGICARPR